MQNHTNFYINFPTIDLIQVPGRSQHRIPRKIRRDIHPKIPYHPSPNTTQTYVPPKTLRVTLPNKPIVSQSRKYSHHITRIQQPRPF